MTSRLLVVEVLGIEDLVRFVEIGFEEDGEVVVGPALHDRV